MQGNMKNDLESIESAMLEEKFAKNIAAIARINSSLYKKIVSTTKTRYQLTLDDQGYFNIAMNGAWLYDNNPQKIATQQYNAFINNPKKFDSHFEINKHLNLQQARTLHALYTKLAHTQYTEIKQQDKAKPCEYISHLIIMGTGLGYHIEQLAQLNVRSIDIYEPNFEVFYFSLFITDYAKIISLFQSALKQISFHIEKKPEDYIQAVYNKNHLRRKFNLSNTHIFEHYTSNALAQDLCSIANLWHKVHNTNGFIEDELYGLNHYRLKLEQHIRHITTLEKKTQLPCFIIGSGPSIDQHIEFIKNIRAHVCLISCSSSIAICEKNGIVPNFHAEVERGGEILDLLSTMNGPKFLQKITLLGLNVIHPAIAKMFKNTIIGLKPNDLATSIVNQYQAQDQQLQSTKKILEIEYCHPTSTNGALSFAIALGFCNITTFGTDLGFQDARQHHAKNTPYFDKQTRWYNPEQQATMHLDAVGGETIGSTLLLEGAKTSFELMCELHPDVNCQNASQGAVIRGFKQVCLSEVEAQVMQHKESQTHIIEVIDQLIIDNSTEFNHKNLIAFIDQQWLRIINKATTIINELNIFHKYNYEKKESLFDLLELQRDEYIRLMGPDDATNSLIQGSTTTLQTLTSLILGTISDGAVLQRHMSDIFTLWQNYLEQCLSLARDNYKKEIQAISIEKYRDIAIKLGAQSSKNNDAEYE